MKKRHAPLKANKRPRHGSRGAVTVELAICLPVLLLFFFASLEFGRVNMLRHAASEAAYEGARRGIAPGSTAADVQTGATGLLSTAWVQGATVSVIPATLAADTTAVTVTVQIPISQNTLAALMFFSGGSTLTGTCTLQREKY